MQCAKCKKKDCYLEKKDCTGIKAEIVDQYSDLERRKIMGERRSREERRDGWVRINKWSSVNLHVLKISKFLK